MKDKFMERLICLLWVHILISLPRTLSAEIIHHTINDKEVVTDTTFCFKIRADAHLVDKASTSISLVKDTISIRHFTNCELVVTWDLPQGSQCEMLRSPISDFFVLFYQIGYGICIVDLKGRQNFTIKGNEKKSEEVKSRNNNYEFSEGLTFYDNENCYYGQLTNFVGMDIIVLVDPQFKNVVYKILDSLEINVITNVKG